jgi:hypothetical protein
MEFISIYTCHKDDSEFDFYPNTGLQDDLDLSVIESFIASIFDHQNESGVVELKRSSYDSAVELLGTDDLPCPSALIIKYRLGQTVYTMSIPFSRSINKAYISSNE